MASDSCAGDASCSATFTVDTPLPIEVNCPADLTVDACLDSLAIDALFRDWLNGFSVDGGCVYDSTRLDTLIAPDSCGGSITVNFMASDSCAGDASCSATFTVDTPLPIEVNCPADLTVDACLDSLAIDALFRDWLNGFSVDGGCVYDSTRLDTLIAPDSCGGSITVNFMASDSCAGDASCSATFTVDAPLPIEVNCPGDTTLQPCLPQAHITNAFDLWLSQFSASGGCGLDSLTLDTALMNRPDSTGGSFTITATAYSPCLPPESCSSTFTVSQPAPVQTTIESTICFADTIIFNGQNIFAEGPYMDTLMAANGCDSIITLNLTVLPPVQSTIDSTICFADTIIFNGQNIFAEGPYMDTLMAANGCDSIITLNLTVLPPVQSTIDSTICFADTITFNGQNIFAEGPYIDTLMAANGCDSFITLNLTVLPPIQSTIDSTICFADTITFNGQNIFAEGPYMDTLMAANGCDSIITLNLEVIQHSASNIIATICPGDTIIINGVEYFQPTMVNDTLPSANGCDSILMINIQFGNEVTTTIDQTICPGDTIIINGVEYFQPTMVNDTLPSANGCDSILMINIQFGNEVTTTIDQTICPGDTIIINGVEYFQPTMVNDTLPSANGCDSILMINIQFGNEVTTTIDQTICPGDTIIINGVEYFQPTMVNDTLPSANGCDSILMINIQFGNEVTTTIDQTICPGDTIIIKGVEYFQPTMVNDTLPSANGCDSILMINIQFGNEVTTTIDQTICPGDTIIINGVEYFQPTMVNDTLPSANGCDSILMINIQFGNEVTTTIDQTICPGDTIIINGVEYFQPTMVNDTLPSANGCDSILMINIQFGNEVTTTIDQTICPGDTIIINGVEYFQPTMVNDTLPSANGCDSILMINIQFGNEVTTTIDQTMCPGDTIIINGVEYFQPTMVNDTLPSANGCDSILMINIQSGNEVTTTIDQTICPGDTIIINGVEYFQPTMVNDTLPSANGCDSILMINIQFGNEVTTTIDQTICPGDTIIINGVEYFQPTMVNDTLPSANGCDSILMINIQFGNEVTTTIDQTICPGDTIIINGVEYFQPTMVNDTLPSANGCDSILMINIQFGNEVTTTIDQTICPGDTIIINGVEYFQPTMVNDTLPSANGCDSILMINIQFGNEVTTTIDQTICPGDTIIINGVEYFQPTMVNDTLPSANGCDSILMINIQFGNEVTTTIDQTICPGDTIIINGVEYFQPTMVNDTLPSANGCDSILMINIQFGNEVTTTIDQTICPGDTIIINGVEYFQPTMVNDTLPSANGCDSILMINIQFGNEVTTTIDQTICPGDTIIINGVEYFQPTMVNDTLPSANGCDSILMINIQFGNEVTTTIDQIICPGDTIIINGVEYFQPTMVNDTLPSANGCDSILMINIQFGNEVTTTIDQTICPGDTIIINGVEYFQPTMVNDTLPSANGCDSILMINIQFGNEVTTNIDQTICPGDTIIINGVEYFQPTMVNDTLPSANGCDSILMINIQFAGQVIVPVTATMCPGDSVEINGVKYFEATQLNDTLQGANGCDSILQIDVSIANEVIVPVNATICPGDSVEINGVKYFQATQLNDTLQGTNGCDSILMIIIEVDEEINTEISDSICAGQIYPFGGDDYSQAGVYKDTLMSSGGCDSIVTLNLSIIEEINTEISDSICAGQIYTFGGDDYSEAGTYSNTQMSSGGCDSIITLNLSIIEEINTEISDSICAGQTYPFGGNDYSQAGVYKDTLLSSGGCDSIITLNLSIIEEINTEISDSICAGQTYPFGGNDYSQAGVYKDTLLSSGGCDSIITLNLSIIEELNTEISDSICAGQFYPFGGDDYSQAGVYKDTLMSSGGCDSIITLNLSIIEEINTEISDSVCAGQTYPFGGDDYSEAGTYKDTLMSSGGCDSIVTLNLSIIEEINTEISDSICAGQFYPFGGNDYSEAGSYKDTLMSSGGCDSIITLNLSIIEEINTEISDSICAGQIYQFGGDDYSQAGVYKDTLLSSGGCDSIITLNLSIIEEINTEISDSICAGQTYPFGGNDYSQAGVYKDTLLSSGGCDSIITLNLSIIEELNTEISDSICAGQFYPFGGDDYSQAGVYKDTLMSSGGCDSIITLNLSIIEEINTEISDSVCAGQTYPFGGDDYSEAGTYKDTLMSSGGCDSIVTLNLSIIEEINTEISDSICAGQFYPFGGDDYAISGIYRDTLVSAGGCDSIVTLTLTVVDEVLETIAAEICQGDQYIFGGINYSTAGVYRDTLMSRGGCDSIVELTLTVLTGSEQNITAEICQGDQYLFAGINYSSSGTYRDTIPASNGCDSIIILELTVHPTAQTLVEQEICEGSSFVFGGQSYNTSGTYHDTLATQHGCDSVITLMLSVLDQFETDIAVQICVGDEYVFGGNTLTQSGIYRDTLSSVDGCDSIIILDLAVVDEIHTPIEAQICAGDQFTFGGNDYAISGIYRDTLVSAGGCDSIVSLTLTVVDEVLETIAAEICQGDQYLFAGINYSTSGVYRDTLMSTGGCDSIVELTLTVLDGSEQNITAEICEGESFVFGNSTLTASGTYRDTITASNGCDSIIILELTVHRTAQTLVEHQICEGSSFVFGGQSYNTSGTYHDTLATQQGCDSVITLMLSVLDQFETDIAVQICVGDEYVFGGNTLTQSGIYRDTLSSVDGCDSIIILDLAVVDEIHTPIEAQICAGDQFTFGGNDYAISGIYRDTLVSAGGCDSIVSLTLTVVDEVLETIAAEICQGDQYLFAGINYSTSGVYRDTLMSTGGCDSIVELTLTVLDGSEQNITAEICEGESFVFGNSTLTASGTYRDTITASNGCDSIIILELTVHRTAQTLVEHQICEGSSFVFGGQSYNTSGTYHDTLATQQGCDSVITLMLSVLDQFETDIAVQICVDDEYVFGGNTLTQSGIYRDTLSSVDGCDSIIILDLAVVDEIHTPIEAQICAGDQFTFGGNDYAISGIYRDTLVSAGGCDSIVTLTLTVVDEVLETIAAEICQGDQYLFAGINYSTSGVYRDTLMSTGGCDSIVELTLTVLTRSEQNITAEICQGDQYLFGGINYTTSGTYRDTIRASNGCDSIIILELTIHPTAQTMVEHQICEGSSFVFGGQSYNTSGTYHDTLATQHGCDSVITLMLSVLDQFETDIAVQICVGDEYVFGGNTLTQSGIYRDTLSSVDGCDSIIILDLAVVDEIHTPN